MHMLLGSFLRATLSMKISNWIQKEFIFSTFSPAKRGFSCDAAFPPFKIVQCIQLAIAVSPRWVTNGWSQHCPCPARPSRPSSSDFLFFPPSGGHWLQNSRCSDPAIWSIPLLKLDFHRSRSTGGRDAAEELEFFLGFLFKYVFLFEEVQNPGWVGLFAGFHQNPNNPLNFMPTKPNSSPPQMAWCEFISIIMCELAFFFKRIINSYNLKLVETTCIFGIFVAFDG